MSSELDELVEFLHHGNSQVRQIACDNLVGYSTAKPAIFKRHQLLPVTDLKLLVRDYVPIAKNAITILINLSQDEEVLQNLAGDDTFVESMLKRITDIAQPLTNELCMLFANLSKSSLLERVITLARPLPSGTPQISSSAHAMDQIMDCFVKEVPSRPSKDYDYLAYVFADLSCHEAGRKYFLTRQNYDGVVPITKLIVFTDEHRSRLRRKGVASTIKNVCFDLNAHDFLVSETGANILPFILLPLAGSEELSDLDTEDMLPDLQLLPSDKERDPDPEILTTHLETLLLLTTGKQGRELLRRVKVYPIVRECHLCIEDELVRESCDRLVQVLLGEDADEGDENKHGNESTRNPAAQENEEDEEEKIVQVF